MLLVAWRGEGGRRLGEHLMTRKIAIDGRGIAEHDAKHHFAFTVFGSFVCLSEPVTGNCTNVVSWVSSNYIFGRVWRDRRLPVLLVSFRNCIFIESQL